MYREAYFPHEPDKHRRLVKRLYGLLFVVIALMWLHRYNTPLFNLGKIAFAASGVVWSIVPRRGVNGWYSMLASQRNAMDWILTLLYATLLASGLFTARWGNLAVNENIHWIAGGMALFIGTELIARHSRGSRESGSDTRQLL